MLKSKKEDPRAVRSKKIFKEAVLSLLVEGTSVAQLTVQKISDRAELNRATFYLHYQDINDLLQHLTNEILDGLSIKLMPLKQSDLIGDQEQLTIFLDYIYENRKLLAILFDHRIFEASLFNLLKNLIEARRMKKLHEVPNNTVSIEIRVSSIMGIIMWWIKDGINFSSEYIANQITLLYRPS